MPVPTARSALRSALCKLLKEGSRVVIRRGRETKLQWRESPLWLENERPVSQAMQAHLEAEKGQSNPLPWSLPKD